jgi:hypothetical protein
MVNRSSPRMSTEITMPLIFIAFFFITHRYTPCIIGYLNLIRAIITVIVVVVAIVSPAEGAPRGRCAPTPLTFLASQPPPGIK